MLSRILPNDHTLRVQDPVRLPNQSEPQPDLAVIDDRDYTETPGVADVLFVVEVADITLLDNRSRKLPLYASVGIPEAWLIDLQAGIVERYSDPHGGAYRQAVFARVGETLDSTVLPAVRIPVADILR